MLKKKFLAVMGVVASSGMAFAGTMGPVCTPGNVTVPCVDNKWDLGVQALYLESIYDADKAYKIIPGNSYSEVNNDWDWGYRLEGSYHFNTGNDVTINWTHIDTDTSSDGYIGLVPVPPFVNVPFSLYNENRFDQVNLVLGQHADFGLVKKMRFYGGLQYANIQVNDTNYYSAGLAGVGITSISLYDNTDFKGIGPVTGIDYSYNLTDSFSITANGEASILFGTSRYNSGYVGAPINLVLASVYGSQKAIVPSLEAKLGVNYAYAMTQGVLNLEAGYQALNYFNALQEQNFNFLAGTITNSDYGLYGPYFGVKYVGQA